MMIVTGMRKERQMMMEVTANMRKMMMDAGAKAINMMNHPNNVNMMIMLTQRLKTSKPTWKTVKLVTKSATFSTEGTASFIPSEDCSKGATLS